MVNHVQTCSVSGQYFFQISFKTTPFLLEFVLGAEVVVKVGKTQWTKPAVGFIASFQA